MLAIKAPEEIAKELASRLRRKRLEYAWSREELASRSGVTVASLKRFETTGEISLKRLLKLCFTLHAIDGFDKVLLPAELRTLADLEKRAFKRKRGRTRKTV